MKTILKTLFLEGEHPPRWGALRLLRLGCRVHICQRGVHKSFLKGMLTCDLYVNDLFNGQRDRWMIRTTNVEGCKNSTTYTRGVELQVSYFFNYKRSKYKGSGAGHDEQNRL